MSLMNYCGCLFIHSTFLGVDKPGEASRRGRKRKLKRKDGGLETERKPKDAEAGLRLLSEQTGSKATCSHTEKVSVSATRPPQKTQSPGPDVARSHAVKSLQSTSRTSASWRLENDKTSSESSKEGSRGGSKLVQSRLAWKTMASPAPPVEALKVRWRMYITGFSLMTIMSCWPVCC